MLAPLHWPYNRPFLVRSPWWRHWWANELHPASGRGVQDGGSTWESLLLFGPICPILACLALLWASPSWEGWVFPPSTTSLPFCSLFLLRLAGSGRRGWVGGGVVSLVWATFLGEFPSGWDFSSSCRVDLGLHWILISSGMEVTPWWWLDWVGKGWPTSLVEASRDKGWLKTSNSSSESETSTTSSSFSSSSFVMAGWEEVVSSIVYYDGRATFGMPSGIGLVVSMPSRIGPAVRKTEATILIRCRRGSFALMTHFDAW